MTPFASVAMLEKLALLKIARCRAPAFSSTSSACLREVTSPAPSETPILVLVTSFPLAMVLPPVRMSLRSGRDQVGAHIFRSLPDECCLDSKRCFQAAAFSACAER